MKICIYCDETINLKLDEMISNLNRLVPSMHFHKGNAEFSLPGSIVSVSQSYKQINKAIAKETANDDEVWLFTEKPYDNNFFFESKEKQIIISFAGWNYLTKLSRNNGAVYFVCVILTRSLGFGESHSRNTGCINDFCWDKTGIDIGMRSAFVCVGCLQEFRKHATDHGETMLREIEAILNDLSTASRSNMDICDFWELHREDAVFDVFICYNSEDKEAIREMNNRLKKAVSRHGLMKSSRRQVGCGRQFWESKLSRLVPQLFL